MCLYCFVVGVVVFVVGYELFVDFGEGCCEGGDEVWD